MKKIVLFFALIGLFPVFSQTLNSLDDIKSYALENSTDYKRVLLDVISARNQLDGFIKMDETSFSFDWEYDNNTDSASARIDVPLIDQLSVNAQVQDDLSGQLGLSISPLYHSDSRQLVDIQEEMVAVKETVYRDERIRYEAGESTLDDLRDDLTDWTESRTTLSNLQTVLRARESILLQALSADLDTASIGIIGIDSLLSELNELKTSLTPNAANSSQLYSVISSYKDVEISKEKLSDTWLFSPTLSMEGLVNLPDVTNTSSYNTPQWEIGVQLTFSQDDWQGKERSEYKQDFI